MGKYKLTWKDLSWTDFKIYLFALFKAFIPKKKIKKVGAQSIGIKLDLFECLYLVVESKIVCQDSSIIIGSPKTPRFPVTFSG